LWRSNVIIALRLERKGPNMPEYRLYTLREADGPFVAFENISALDDVDAVRIARAFKCARPMELWCGKRRVKSFPAFQPEAA
jgi:hypothetical protein